MMPNTTLSAIELRQPARHHACNGSHMPCLLEQIREEGFIVGGAWMSQLRQNELAGQVGDDDPFDESGAM
jgi:hypothetical protein